MPRTITVEDHESGVVAAIVVAADPETAAPLVQSITFTATNGRGVRAADLLVLRDFGLVLPPELLQPVDNPPVVHRGALAKTPARTTAKPAQKAPAKKAVKAAPEPAMRPYRNAPPDAELIAEYTRLNGSPKGVAEHYHVPRHTAQHWISRLRRDGLIPPSGSSK